MGSDFLDQTMHDLRQSMVDMINRVTSAHAAFELLDSEEKVAVRLRFGDNIIEWYKMEYNKDNGA